MRDAICVALLTAVATGFGLASDSPVQREVSRPAVLTPEARAELRALLPKAMQKARPAFPRAAMTMEQARKYAEVDRKMTWQAEYGDWFVFSVPGPKGGPDRWSGVIFVQKETNLVGFYRETW